MYLVTMLVRCGVSAIPVVLSLRGSNVVILIADKISSPLVVYGLLPHENKMSVMHYVIKRTSNYTLPIKSKVGPKSQFPKSLRSSSLLPVLRPLKGVKILFEAKV